MIEVLAIPPLATVQDLGRDGHWFQGLGRAGAMDGLSHSAANFLLGNDETAATLEIPLTTARLRFHGRQAFALAGAPCNARLDGRALPRVWAGVAEDGQLLELGGMPTGSRVYLALAGGIDVPEVLGSRSTQLREAFGGLEGRVIAPGDRLRARSNDLPDFPEAGLSLDLPPLRQAGENHITLRALASTEHDEFSADAQSAFWSTAYGVTPQSNRQGYRLEGEALTRVSRGELRSHGIVPGIVQVPGGGQPIIQLADSATMGGYPKIAAVITPDLWRIAQARPGDRLRFVRVDLAEAERAEREAETLFKGWKSDIARVSRQMRSWA